MYSFSRPHSLNSYAYAGNNPVNRIDPTGHSDCGALMTAEVVTVEVEAEAQTEVQAVAPGVPLEAVVALAGTMISPLLLPL